MENDLDTAEDKAKDSTGKLKEAEARIEELERTVKQQSTTIDTLEGGCISAGYYDLQ